MKKRKYLLAGAGLALTALFIIAASILYSRHIRKTLEKETFAYAQEISAQSVKLISERLESDNLYLKEIAQLVSTYGTWPDMESVMDILDEKVKSTRFTRFAVVDKEGNMYYKGMEGHNNVFGTRYFQKAIKGEEAVDAIVTEEEVKRVIVTAVPIFESGQPSGVIVGWYSMEEIEKLMEVSYLNKKGYSCIVDQNGEILANSSADLLSGNFASEIAGAHSNSVTKEEANSMARDMEMGVTGYLLYEEEGKEFLLNYMPASINGWYLVLALPATIVDSKASQIINSTVWYCSLMLFAVVAVSAAALIAGRLNYRHLRKAYNNIQSIYRTVPNAIIQFRLDDRLTILSANNAFYHLLNGSKTIFEKSAGSSLESVLDEEDRDWFRVLKTGMITHEFELRCLDGKQKWIYANLDVGGEGKDILVQGAFVDITKQKEKLEQAEQTARMDSLTGIKNKRAVEYELDERIQTSGFEGAYMILDLDNFKLVNDTFGHPKGDETLRIFAECMNKVFRKDDFVARIGGDEFLIYIPCIAEEEAIQSRVRRLLDLFDSRLEQKIKDCGLSGSVGVAICPKDGIKRSQLYSKADKALYAAKDGGKNQICFYKG